MQPKWMVLLVGVAMLGGSEVARADALILADAQMDAVTAGAFTVSPSDSNLLGGFHNNIIYSLQSDNNGATFTASPGDVEWTTQGKLFISTSQGYAVGVLSNSQGQYWDGEYILPVAYVMSPNIIRP